MRNSSDKIPKFQNLLGLKASWNGQIWPPHFCITCFGTFLDVCSKNNWMGFFTKKFRTFDPHLPIVWDKVLKKTVFFLTPSLITNKLIHLVIEVREENKEGDHVGDARVLRKWVCICTSEATKAPFGANQWLAAFHLHPHWEVAANPDGVETHHQGGNELDHLSEARMILPWTTMALMTAGMVVTVIGWL